MSGKGYYRTRTVTKTVKIDIISDFREAMDLGQELALFVSAFSKDFLPRIGQVAVKQIQSNIRRGGGNATSSPLHPMTISLKGHKHPLINTGNMIKTVKATVTRHRVDIGWANAKANKTAAIADYGITIPVTEGMRRLFAGKGFPLKSSTTLLRVKPRPITGTAIQQMFDNNSWDRAFEQSMTIASKNSGLAVTTV
jgi:hypothetical protein